MVNYKTLGRYEILAQLGQGGMGIVLKGRDPRIDRIIALKIIKLEEMGGSMANEELLERFYIEAKAAGKLTHPNIVTIYDVGEEEGKSFMAMEFVEGKDLAEILVATGPMPFRRSANLVSQVADGLAFAHSRGIIHRDIKPGNILVEKNDHVKITDFGLARLQASGSVTQTGHAVGSPSYMSPEQVQGGKVAGHSDQFSLGVMFYELLTGKRPFEGESITTVIYKIIQEHPVPPSRLIKTLDKDADHIVLKMLQKDPADRYRSLKDVVSAIKPLLDETEINPNLSKEVIDKRHRDAVTIDFDSSSAALAARKTKFVRFASAILLFFAAMSGVWFLMENEIRKVAGPLLETEIVEPQRSQQVEEPQDITEKAPIPAVAPPTTKEQVSPEAVPVPAIVEKEPEPAMVSIVSPVKGNVFIDNTPLGITPMRDIEIEPGTHSLRVEAEGYMKWEKEIVAMPGKRVKVNTELVLIKGVIVISGPVLEANVYVDNDWVGVSPMKYSIAPGPHTVRLEKPGYEPLTSTVTVTGDKPEKVSASLVQKKGELKITSTSGTATIYLDGKKIGVTPMTVSTLPGERKVKLTRDGYSPYTTTVTVSLDRSVAVAGNLKKLEGQLRITNSAKGADIYLDGRKIGVAPLSKGMAPGTYRLKVIKPGFRKYETKIVINADSPKIVSPILVELGKGVLSVSAIPWATIYLNNEEMGATPKRLNDVTEGKIKIKLVNPSFKPFETTIDLKKNETVSVSHVFTAAEAVSNGTDKSRNSAQRGYGGLKITSKPEGVVFVDGKLLGKTPIVVNDLVAGVHSVIIKRPGVKNYRRKVTIVKGMVTRIAVE